jgi:hypothetical protein
MDYPMEQDCDVGGMCGEKSQNEAKGKKGRALAATIPRIV